MSILSATFAQETPASTTTPATTTPAAASAPLATLTPVAAPQTTEESPSLMFGLKFAPSYNWISIDRDGYDTDGGYVGYIYGIMTDFRISNTNYYFSTGLEVSARGGKYKSTEIEVQGRPNAAGTVTQRFQYLDVPLSLKLKTKEIGYSKYYGNFGVIPGLMTKANRDIDFDNDNLYSDQEKAGNMSEFGFFNFGILLGAGMEYKFSGNSVINVGLTYHNSFVDVWTVKKATLNANYISLNLGIFF
ncbi:MAG TPA: porin family protein [Bacteroidia bacterium]|nr:porin family protein [Bacteroidia bacterium]